MRGCVAIIALSLAVLGCSSARHSEASPRSLAALRQLGREEASFGVIVDAKTGRALTAFRVNNPLRTAVADGKGGWYVGGGFIRVNGQLRKRLAHIDRGGRLDQAWRPEANGNGVSVTSLARIGSRLFVAGDFAKLNKRPRLWLGGVDTRTGKLLGWQPRHAAINYPVLRAGSGRLYVGGYAVTSGSGLVALRPEDGTRDRRWRGKVDTSNVEGGSVRMIAVRGKRVYVGGMFGKVDGVSVPGIAAVDAETGTRLREWRPPLRSRYCVACTDVTALAVGRSRIFASGSAGVVALDPVTGAIQRHWRARIGLKVGIYGGAAVNAMARADGRLYLAGDFDSIEGTHRHAFGVVDAETGRLLPSWTPAAPDAVGSVVVPSGDRLLVGVQLRRAVRFAVGGLEAARQPFARLNVLLALSGPGSVRVGLGRRCNYERWAETGRCEGTVERWLGTVRFSKAGRRRFRHDLPGQAGGYFVRFVPRARGGEPQPAYDDAFRH